MNEHIPTFRRAAARAEWLAKLSEALDIADKLTIELGREAEQVPEVTALTAKIALLRVEIDAIRRGRPPGPDKSPPQWRK